MPIPAGFKCNQWGWFWKESDNSGPYFLDRDGKMVQGIPSVFQTDSKGDGPFSRLRVDHGSTGFFAGRTFRSFVEYNIPSAGSVVVRFRCPVDHILEDISVEAYAGTTRYEARSGGTPGGTFGTPQPVLPANFMTSAGVYTSLATIDTGGTYTGGSLRDVGVINTGQGASTAIRLLTLDSPAGRNGGNDLYLLLSNPGNQNTQGVFRLRWEERPSGV